MEAYHIYNKTLKSGSNNSMGKQIFEGEIHGIVSSNDYIAEFDHNFSFKSDDRIAGIPDELHADYLPPGGQPFGHNLFLVKTGDKIIIKGKLFHGEDKFFKRETFYMQATNVYNKTLNCG